MMLSTVVAKFFARMTRVGALSCAALLGLLLTGCPSSTPNQPTDAPSKDGGAATGQVAAQDDPAASKKLGQC
jgi:hypothetical protein